MAFEIFKMMGVIAVNKEQALKDIQAVGVQAQKTATEMSKSFEKAGKYITDHSAQFRKAGLAMTAVGAVILLAVKNISKAYDEYETKLVDMGKVTDESLEVIEDRIQSLPPILGSATDLLSGYYQIVSAGVKDTAEAMEVLTVSAQTASAAHIAQSEVVLGITKMMAGYEGSIEDASDAADLLFAIEKEGQVTVAGLIPIIGGLAKVSFDLNISQQEMGASMAVISKTAGSAAEAGTQYEAIITGLMKPTEEMSAALIKMGKEYNGVGFATAEAAIKELGFVEVMRELDKATGGSSEALGTLFGRKEAMVGFSALSAQNFKVLGDSIVSVGESTGSAQKAFDAWSKTGEAMDKIWKSTIQNLKILVGEILDPMMDTIQKHLTNIATSTLAWVKAHEDLTRVLTVSTAGLGGVLLILGPMVMMLPSLVAGFKLLSAATVILSGKFAALAVTLGMTAPQLLLMAAAFILITKATYGWIDAIKESKRIKEMEVVATNAQTDAYQKLADRLGVSVEQIKEWQKEELTVTEMCKRAGYQMKETGEAIDENTDATIDNIYATIENTEATVENTKAKDTLLTASGRVEAEIANLTAEYELSNKTTEETVEYNSKLIEKYRELIEKLKEEQRQHKEGTVEYQNYTSAINDTLIKIKELALATGTLMTASEKVEAEIANITAAYVLSNKTTEDTKNYTSALIGKYRELIGVYSEEQNKLKQGTVEYQNYTLAINAASLKIKELTEAQAVALVGLKATNAELTVLENKYSDVAKDEEYFTEKARLLKEQYEQLNIQLNETEFHSDEWYDLTNQLLDNEEAARELKEQYEKLNFNKLADEIDLVDGQLTLLDATFSKGGDAVDYYQQKIGLLNNKHDLLIKQLEDLELHYKGNSVEALALKASIASVEGAIANLSTALYESQHPWETFFSNLKEKYSDTIGSIQTGISNFVSAFQGAIETALTSLWHMKETNDEIQQQMAETEQEYIDEKLEMNEGYKQDLIQKLAEYVDEKELANMTIAELETLLKEHSIAAYTEMSEANQAKLDELGAKYDEILGDMEGEQVTFGSIMQNLWKTLVDAIITELIRIAAQYVVMWLISMFAGSKGGGVGYKLGGEIEKYDLGGQIKRMRQFQARTEYLQSGGPKGTDTVPAWLTPGEYVIAKPMTDFIRKTGAITGNLIRSIQTGSRTPAPGFAEGGLVAAGAGGYGSIELNIMPGAVNINTKYLDDRAISQAGTKLFAEFEKQARNAGKILVGR